MKKRKWIYLQQPGAYDVFCDKCEGTVVWSEFEGRVWCERCKIDTRGTGGIFDGPIPVQVAEMMGISFDRIYFKDKSIRKMQIRGNKLIWLKSGGRARRHGDRF